MSAEEFISRVKNIQAKLSESDDFQHKIEQIGTQDDRPAILADEIQDGACPGWREWSQWAQSI